MCQHETIAVRASGMLCDSAPPVRAARPTAPAQSIGRVRALGRLALRSLRRDSTTIGFLLPPKLSHVTGEVHDDVLHGATRDDVEGIGE